MRRFVVVLFVVAAFAANAVDEHPTLCPPQYAYCGWTGPQQWPHLPESKCGGAKQSPVNITGWRTQAGGPKIEVSYSDRTAAVFNSGHDIKATPPTANNFIRVNGIRYPLVEVHFHTPSEHHLRGAEYPAEAHFVHLVGQDDYRVIAVLLPIERQGNAVFAPIFASLPRNVCTSSSVALHWSRLLPKEIVSYYTYKGSLTTPPCKETATFYIANNTGLSLSNTQRSSLHSLGENARRPLQPINGRPITLVTPR